MSNYDDIAFEFSQTLNNQDTTKPRNVKKLLNQLDRFKAEIEERRAWNEIFKIYGSLFIYYFRHEVFKPGAYLFVTAFSLFNENNTFTEQDYTYLKRLVVNTNNLPLEQCRIFTDVQVVSFITPAIIMKLTEAVLFGLEFRNKLMNQMNFSKTFWINDNPKCLDALYTKCYKYLETVRTNANRHVITVLYELVKKLNAIEQYEEKKISLTQCVVWMILEITASESTYQSIETFVKLSELLPEAPVASETQQPLVLGPSLSIFAQLEDEDSTRLTTTKSYTMELKRQTEPEKPKQKKKGKESDNENEKAKTTASASRKPLQQNQDTPLPATNNLVIPKSFQPSTSLTPLTLPVPPTITKQSLSLPVFPNSSPSSSSSPFSSAKTSSEKFKKLRKSILSSSDSEDSDNPPHEPAPPVLNRTNSSKPFAATNAVSSRGIKFNLPTATITTPRADELGLVPPRVGPVAQTTATSGFLSVVRNEQTGYESQFFNIPPGIYAITAPVASRPKIQLSIKGLRFGPFAGDALRKMTEVLRIMRSANDINELIPENAHIMLDRDGQYIFYPFQLRDSKLDAVTRIGVNRVRQRGTDKNVQLNDLQKYAGKGSEQGGRLRKPKQERQPKDPNAPPGKRGRKKKNAAKEDSDIVDDYDNVDDDDDAIQGDENADGQAPKIARAKKINDMYSAAQAIRDDEQFVLLKNFNISRVASPQNTSNYKYKLENEGNASQITETEIMLGLKLSGEAIHEGARNYVGLFRNYAIYHYVLTGQKMLPYFTLYKVELPGNKYVMFAMPDIFGSDFTSAIGEQVRGDDEDFGPLNDEDNDALAEIKVQGLTLYKKTLNRLIKVDAIDDSVINKLTNATVKFLQLPLGRTDKVNDFIVQYEGEKGSETAGHFTPEVYALGVHISTDLSRQRGEFFAYMLPPYYHDPSHMRWFDDVYEKMKNIYDLIMLNRNSDSLELWKRKFFDILALLVLSQNNYLSRLRLFLDVKYKRQPVLTDEQADILKRDCDGRKRQCRKFLLISCGIERGEQISPDNMAIYNEYIDMLSRNPSGAVVFNFNF